MTREETSKYSDLMPDGRTVLFSYPMDVKSVITSPSPGLELKGPGLYQISGMAWSGLGRVARVEVSADGGATWAEAGLVRTGAGQGRYAIPHGVALERRRER